MSSPWKIRLLALAALPLLAMGNLAGGGNAAPERNYAGTLVDRDGVEVEARWITAGGEVHLPGELGRGSLRISFDDIETVEFNGNQRDDLEATVRLREAEPVTIRVRSSLTFTGQTDIGLYRIRARDLKSIEISH